MTSRRTARRGTMSDENRLGESLNLMRRNLFAITLCAATAFLAGAAPLSAQVKIGVVDFQQALLNTADMQKRAGELEAKFKPRQEALEAITSELQQIQQQLQTAAPEAAQQLQNEGARKQREAQRMGEDLQAEVEFERDAILQDGAQRMRAVIEKLRESKALDMVVDVSTTVSYSPTLDLTADATAAYDTAHPVQ